MRTVRFTKIVAVDFFDSKLDELTSKSFNRWDTVRVNSIYELSYGKCDMELIDGSKVYDVPVNSFEVLPI